MLKLDKELIIISGNNSRKHKQFRIMLERRKLFGDISAKDENGRSDLIAFSASQGRIITSSITYDIGAVPVRVSVNKAKNFESKLK